MLGNSLFYKKYIHILHSTEYRYNSNNSEKCNKK